MKEYSKINYLAELPGVWRIPGPLPPTPAQATTSSTREGEIFFADIASNTSSADTVEFKTQQNRTFKNRKGITTVKEFKLSK